MSTANFAPANLGTRFSVSRGETWDPIFILKRDSDVIDLTPAAVTATMHVRAEGGTGAATSLAGVEIAPLEGKVQFFLEDEWTTTNDAGVYCFDIEVKDSSTSPATHTHQAAGKFTLADPCTGTFTAD